MATMLKPETETRIADLARRLGFAGPDAVELVLHKALDDLEAQTAPVCRKMTPEEIAEEYELLSAAGRRWREENPDKYDENNPPSKVWQDDLYDEQGLPK